MSDVEREAPWIGVDLDGTLAVYTGWKDAWHVGAPIPRMVARVKQWLTEGKRVKIMTARASITDGEIYAENILAINAWCREHIGVELEITCVKDLAMVQLWDDRAVSVIKNTGVALVLDG